ncbi:MAG TPA: methyltransferase domain-containing protein, partial [Candidatus Bathyarchaeia archaeon]|nr:methyltransferase domain-containing protein [Candidatus Bathyarchaeia archaeon]
VVSLPDGRPMPEEVRTVLVPLRVIGPSASLAGTALLNEAVRAASADLVAILDGDCLPDAGWLRAALRAMRAHPDAAAVSGRTLYPQDRLSYRVLGVLSRSFVDPGRAGPTGFITNYNAIFRREVLLAHPLPAGQRALAARLQSESIRLAGGALYFEPGMRVTHRFEGWTMERKIRRSVGYRAIRVRQLEPRVHHAWMVRLGRASIPLVVAARTLDSWWDCLRVGRYHGVRWYEMPAAMATAVAVHLMEIDGMRSALAEARSPAGGVADPGGGLGVLWRTHSDAVNAAWLEQRLQPSAGRLLKTDTFDEALTAGLFPLLSANAGTVVGMDLSAPTVRAACARHARLRGTCADVRALPFASGSFDGAVSNSTLDHFTAKADIAVSLAELHRVLRPGGRLLLTLDNLANPVVRLRNLLPYRLLYSLGLVPYFVGATCAPRELERLVRQAGFEVLEIGAILHCPRVLAVATARLLERRGSTELERSFLSVLMKMERLAGRHTRFLSGHFVTVVAVKP